VLLETIADIKDGMTRIKDIVSDLRTFAYPENEARVETFTVECLVDSALRMLAHELKDQKLVREIEPNQQIHGSKIQLSHVLINFLSNSLKAIKKIKELREPTSVQLKVIENQLFRKPTILISSIKISK
jgi:C4-dicarboxylate-specific signal transduction histidine kinase